MFLSDIAKIIQGKLNGEDNKASAFSIDSRELLPGEVFIALKGQQYDGHNFLKDICDKKAAGAIVSTPMSLPIPTIQVNDTIIALGQIAASHRRRFNLPIIAVTGSCGKTTTKSMIANILHHMGATLAPIKSFNNSIGVPLTLLQLTEQHHYAVIEMGANHIHEIGYLSSLAQQTVALVTNVAPAHLEGFGSIEGVAKTKGEIYQALPANGIAILNADDAFLNQWQQIVAGKTTLTFSTKKKADIFANNIKLDAQGKTSFTVHYPKGTVEIALPLLGVHNVNNALAAIAATVAVGASEEAIVKGLTHLAPVNNRLVRCKGLADASVIDDTYNANPLSVKAALEMLSNMGGERIFVLGDMAELGDQAEKFHAEVGVQARQLGIDKLYACGKLSQLAASAFGNHGFHFPDQQGMIAAIRAELHPNATVLIKGSRSSRMEHVVEAITQEN